MYTGNRSVSTRIIDYYLELLVLQDIKRYPVNHNMKYVPTSFFTTLQSNDPQNTFYSQKMHSIFVNQKMWEYDGMVFGGTDTKDNFFTVVLFLKKKEVFILDPFDFSSTIAAVAKFLHLLFQHSDWLENDSKNFKPCKNYTFSDDVKKNWTVCDVKSESKFMPVAGESQCDSGLHLIMLCEAFIRGYLPTYDSKMVESIRANGHLITSLATGIPLLGKCSLYPVELYNTSRMDNPHTTTQKRIFGLLPDQFHYLQAHHRRLEGIPYACCLTGPYPYESHFLRTTFEIPGERICMGGDGNCLFYCYCFLLEKFVDTTNYNSSSPNKFLPNLQSALLKTIKESLTEDFLDCAANGVLENLAENDKQSLETRLKFDCFYLEEYDQRENTIHKINAKNLWEATVSFEVDKTKFDNDYDPFDEKNIKEDRMPDSAELFHFAFCKLFQTTIVVYTIKPDWSKSTQIYCHDPADKRIMHSEGIHVQDFKDYPNQIVFYKPNNYTKETDNSTMHFDVLLSDDQFMKMDLGGNYDGQEIGNQKDSGDDGDDEVNTKKKPAMTSKHFGAPHEDDETNTSDGKVNKKRKPAIVNSKKVAKRRKKQNENQKSDKKKASSVKNKKVKATRKISQSLQNEFEKVYENEKKLDKFKNTKVDFSVDFLSEVEKQEYDYHKQRKLLDQNLKKAFCVSYRDLVDERKSLESQEKKILQKRSLEIQRKKKNEKIKRRFFWIQLQEQL